MEGGETGGHERFNTRHFQALAFPEEAELAPFWAAGIAREGTNERTALGDAAGCTLDRGQDGLPVFCPSPLESMTRSEGTVRSSFNVSLRPPMRILRAGEDRGPGRAERVHQESLDASRSRPYGCLGRRRDR